jgi:hypothetical protein
MKILSLESELFHADGRIDVQTDKMALITIDFRNLGTNIKISLTLYKLTGGTRWRSG